MAVGSVGTAKPGETFLVSECYPTIQGESSLVGTPTIFVRLYGCNLRCRWCDSMHAVEGGEFTERSVRDVTMEVVRLSQGEGPTRFRGIRHVCWTGGEPLLQGRSIARAIRELPPDFVHSIETDGEVDLGPFDADVGSARDEGRVRYVMDVKCPGSGMTPRRAFENLRLLRRTDEVKFVILDRGDYDFARRVLADHPVPAGTVLFSPAALAHHVAKGLDPAALASWILEDRLDVRLQPQLHKFIWPGRERGI